MENIPILFILMMGKRKTQEECINDFIKVHGGKYDYSKVEYKNNKTKVCIICPEHGEFWQTPNSHLNGSGCNKCGIKEKTKKNSLGAKIFIGKSNKLHKCKYDYSKVEYVNSHTKVCIICPDHGEFWQIPSDHLNCEGCPICGRKETINSRKIPFDLFVERANEKYNGFYQYDERTYVNTDTKMRIVCPMHGEFWQTPHNHLNGGCKLCGLERRKKNQYKDYSYFVNKSNLIHHNKYNYNFFVYKGNKIKGLIVCPEHGEFWQTPHDHLEGSGCPKCKSSHIEGEIRNILIENNINFEEQKKFEWLGLQSLDFYLPYYNIAIECQGIQHFEPVEHFGGTNRLLQCRNRDERKRKLCEENEIRLLYYANYEYDFPYEVITNKDKLIDMINCQK